MEENTTTYTFVTDPQDLPTIVSALEGAEAVGVDTETTSLSPRDGRARLLQLATPEQTFVIDLFEVRDISPLKEVLENGLVKIFHNCVPLDTDVLTPGGWRPIGSISRGDTVMGYAEGRQRWTRVTEYVDGGEQEVIETYNTRRKWRSTTSHRWVCHVRRGERGDRIEEVYRTTDDLRARPGNQDRVIHSAPFDNPSPSNVSPDEAALTAWLWGDGTVHAKGRYSAKRPSFGGGNRIPTRNITQSENNRDYCARIEILLRSLGVEPRYSRLPESPHIRRYKVPGKLVAEVYEKAGLDLDDPDYEGFVLGLSAEALGAWFEAFWFAEGSKSVPFPQVFCQTRKANPGKFEALLLAGHLLGRTPKPRGDDFLGFGRPTTTMRKVEHRSLGTERVACLGTETSNFVMRQGDFVTITGNSKFDYQFLKELHGISVAPVFDTMLAAQLLDGGRQGATYGLDAVAERYLDESPDKSEQRSDWSGKLTGRQLEYAARDAAVLLPLREKLLEVLEAEELVRVSKIEFAAVSSIAEMELAGVKLDVARWKDLEKAVRERRDEAAIALEAHFPEPEGVLPLEGLGPRLNLNSPQQITDAFRSIGVELADTKVWTLLKVDHPAARDLLRYRELQKKLGTYLETYPKFIHPKTGRIHASFLQCRVPTGRLACVAEGTLVEVARDQSRDFSGVPVEEIKAGDLAYTYDENRRLTLRKVLWAGKTGHKEVLSIRWRSGSHKREGVLEVTPDHEVRLSSGEYARADRLEPGDRVMALGRDAGSWGYSRIYATGYPGPMREHRFIFEAANGYLPEHVHHIDENKLNNLPENLAGLTNSEHVGHHVNGRMDDAERARLGRIAREAWERNRGARLALLKRGNEHHNWLALEKEWMEEVLWENAGKPTAFRDIHGIDYETACKYLRMHGINWKTIADHFTAGGELIDESFYEATRKRMGELGFNAGLKASGIGSRRWKKIQARFEGAPAVPHNHKILSVQRTGRYADVYDLEIEDTHNFIAGEICVHNCANPNIQQIPHEEEFRRCFVAEDGYTLVIADYSQIELRILAEVSGDPAFVDAFQKGEDLHSLTAATMYGIRMEEVTRDQRSDAKRINFGLMYGRGAKSLSAQLGTDEARGRQLIDEYFANYPKVQRFLQRTANRATRDRTLRTLAGRVRKFGNDPVEDDRGAMRREAMNYPIQGCVLGETRVFERSRGYVPIRSLTRQSVSVWDGGRFSEASVAPSGKKRLVRVLLKGGHVVECSPDHKFLVRNNNGGEAWKPAREIRAQERVVLADGLGKWELDLSLSPADPGRAWNANTADLNEIGTREELGEWLGRVASDGSVGERQIHLLVAEHEEVLLPKLLSLTQRLGHVTHRTRVTERQPKRLHTLTFSCRGLAQQMKRIGVKKRIPDVAWRSRSVLCGYLRGLFDGDGTAHPDGPVLTFGRGDKHLRWAREVQEALLLLGIRSRIGAYDNRVNVRVMKKDVPLFCSEVGFMNPAKQEKSEAVTSSPLSVNGKLQTAYGRAQKVESVEVTDEWVEMYDVVNSETERFAANGVVTHNSSADIAKLALAYMRRELEDLDARLVNSIHDEFVVECREDLSGEVSEKMRGAMTKAGERILEKVPVEVEVVVSREWTK